MRPDRTREPERSQTGENRFTPCYSRGKKRTRHHRQAVRTRTEGKYDRAIGDDQRTEILRRITVVVPSALVPGGAAQHEEELRIVPGHHPEEVVEQVGETDPQKKGAEALPPDHEIDGEQSDRPTVDAEDLKRTAEHGIALPLLMTEEDVLGHGVSDSRRTRTTLAPRGWQSATSALTASSTWWSCRRLRGSPPADQ